ncbi:hypothetical protein M8J75_010841 [Diaphorina citri]|nr:hypothetical protein M8J75_010841 [Diaphorina citri]
MYLPHHLRSGTRHVLPDLEILTNRIVLQVAGGPAPSPHPVLELGKHGRGRHRTPTHRAGRMEGEGGGGGEVLEKGGGDEEEEEEEEEEEGGEEEEEDEGGEEEE